MLPEVVSRELTVRVPVPLFASTVISLLPWQPTARSRSPSLSRSNAVIDTGRVPTANVVLVPNVPALFVSTVT